MQWMRALRHRPIFFFHVQVTRLIVLLPRFIVFLCIFIFFPSLFFSFFFFSLFPPSLFLFFFLFVLFSSGLAGPKTKGASRFGGGPTCHQDCAVCTGDASNCNVYRSWTVQDYLMAQPFNTSKIVFMEVSTNTSMQALYGPAEARWVQHLADTTEPRIKGIVARCPLEAGAVVESCLAEVRFLFDRFETDRIE